MGIAALVFGRKLAEFVSTFVSWAVREVGLFEITAGTTTAQAEPGLPGTQSA